MSRPTKCPAPSGFRPAGEVVVAKIPPYGPPFLRKRRYTGARAEGVRYEAKVQEYLLDRYPGQYLPGPWLHFAERIVGSERAEFAWRWCQPDGLLVDLEGGIITVIEVKRSHTSDAWWQVRHLYTPVLRKLFPEALWTFRAVEVVKWFDPATSFPEKTQLCPELLLAPPNFGIHIWRP